MKQPIRLPHVQGVSDFGVVDFNHCRLETWCHVVREVKMKEQLWRAEAPSFPFFAYLTSSFGSCMCKIRRYVAVRIGEGRSVLLPTASIQLMQVLQEGWLFLKKKKVTILQSAVQCFSSHMSHEECGTTAPYEGIDNGAQMGGESPLSGL